MAAKQGQVRMLDGGVWKDRYLSVGNRGIVVSFATFTTTTNNTTTTTTTTATAPPTAAAAAGNLTRRQPHCRLHDSDGALVQVCITTTPSVCRTRNAPLSEPKLTATGSR